jgi:hypothetical protein
LRLPFRVPGRGSIINILAHKLGEQTVGALGRLFLGIKRNKQPFPVSEFF